MNLGTGKVKCSRSFGGRLAHFRLPCILKRTGRRAKQLRFGHREQIFSVCRVLLAANCSRPVYLIWCIAFYFHFRKTCMLKTTDRRTNGPTFAIGSGSKYW